MVKPPPKRPSAQTKMLEGLFKKISSFGDTEFDVGDIKFNIAKIPPMAGFRLAEEIRVNLVFASDKFDTGEGSEASNATLFIKSIMGLDPSFIKKLMDSLFEYVEYSGGGSGVEKGWAKLKGLEDSAFQDFEVIQIYEVLVRALYVNFSGSFSGMLSNFPGIDKILPQ